MKNKINFSVQTILGIIFIIPATIFLSSVFLKYIIGIPGIYDLISPAISLKPVEVFTVLGPVVALIINLFYLLKINAAAGQGEINFNFKVKLNPAGIIVSAISFIYCALIFSYGITENLGHYYRGQM